MALEGLSRVNNISNLALLSLEDPIASFVALKILQAEVQFCDGLHVQASLGPLTPQCY